MHPKRLFLVIKDAGSQWISDNALSQGAALAYYSIFSMAPLLIIVTGIAGMIFGREAAEGQVTAQIKHLIGSQGGDAVEAMIKNVHNSENGPFANGLGILMLLLGAAGVFGQLQDSLNTIWRVKPNSSSSLFTFFRYRFLSLSMVVGTAFLLLVSLVVSTVLTALGGFGGWGENVFGYVVMTSFDLIIITGLFAMIYKILPDARISWRDVWLGAFFTAILFILGKFLIGLYLGQAAIGSAYGAAGSLAVLLAWIYYAALIFLFGAEMTRAYAFHTGSRIAPKDHAKFAPRHDRIHGHLDDVFPMNS